MFQSLKGKEQIIAAFEKMRLISFFLVFILSSVESAARENVGAVGDI